MGGDDSPFSPYLLVSAARDHSLYSAILFDHVTIDRKRTGQEDRSAYLVEENSQEANFKKVIF